VVRRRPRTVTNSELECADFTTIPNQRCAAARRPASGKQAALGAMRKTKRDSTTGARNAVITSTNRTDREAPLFQYLTRAGLAGLLLTAGFLARASAEDAHVWLDAKLLAAAKAEGGEMTIYSSTNEGEGLPLWKLFTDATGIKVNYVRASDAILMSRMTLEYRANQKSWDIAQTASINKVPPALLRQFDPPEASNIMASARDPGRRWYGLYANYNTPAYNTGHVKASELPKTYADFAQHKEWAGHVAIDGTDNEWLKAMFDYYGADKATKLIKDIVATLRPVVTVGHLAQARSVGSGEYWLSLNNYVNLTMNVKLKGGPIDYFALDPVTLFFGQVGVSSKAPHPNTALLAANFMLSKECEAFLTKFGRIPTRPDVESNPPGIVKAMSAKKVITVLLTPQEEGKWQRQFNQLFKGQ
jgi:ABC-type Fe3+ transport system substrate-binding protein